MAGAATADAVKRIDRAVSSLARPLGPWPYAEPAGIPCVAYPIQAEWAAQGVLTERAAPQPEEAVAEVAEWLDAHAVAGWHLVLPEHTPVPAGYREVLALHADMAERDCGPPELASGLELVPAAEPEEFLVPYGAELAPVLTGSPGPPDDHLVLLRAHGQPVACARVRQAAGTAYVSAVTVAAGHRGHGLGLAVSRAAAHLAWGLSDLAWLHREGGLARLYAPLGFAPVTVHRHVVRG